MGNYPAVKAEAAKIVPAAAPFIAPSGAPFELSSTFAAIWTYPLYLDRINFLHAVYFNKPARHTELAGPL